MKTTIRALIADGMHGLLPSPEDDPLTETDVLQEAHLVGIWLSTSTSTAGLLFDLRQALARERGNTALLVARGVRRIEWNGEPWSTGWLAWVIGTSVPKRAEGLVSLDLRFEHPVPGSGWPRCEVVAERAEYYIGDVPGIPDTPPDFGSDGEATIRRGMPNWDSPFEVHCATWQGGAKR